MGRKADIRNLSRKHGLKLDWHQQNERVMIGNPELQKKMYCACITHWGWIHYADVIMTKMASQITSLTVVYSTVYSDADQIKHQSSASLAFVWRIHRDRWIPRTKGQLRGKCFHLMTSSWTHICVSTLNIIDTDNGLSPGRRQAITWSKVEIVTLRSKLSEILIEIHIFPFKKMSSVKCQPFCLGLNVLRSHIQRHHITRYVITNY